MGTDQSFHGKMVRFHVRSSSIKAYFSTSANISPLTSLGSWRILMSWFWTEVNLPTKNKCSHQLFQLSHAITTPTITDDYSMTWFITTSSNITNIHRNCRRKSRNWGHMSQRHHRCLPVPSAPLASRLAVAPAEAAGRRPATGAAPSARPAPAPREQSSVAADAVDDRGHRSPVLPTLLHHNNSTHNKQSVWSTPNAEISEIGNLCGSLES